MIYVPWNNNLLKLNYKGYESNKIGRALTHCTFEVTIKSPGT